MRASPTNQCQGLRAQALCIARTSGEAGNVRDRRPNARDANIASRPTLWITKLLPPKKRQIAAKANSANVAVRKRVRLRLFGFLISCLISRRQHLTLELSGGEAVRLERDVRPNRPNRNHAASSRIAWRTCSFGTKAASRCSNVAANSGDAWPDETRLLP